ncbi:MAG: phosphatase PAP2 family protein [Cyanobacteriota bacterium]|nr:phosphatase PAP2 family protein [Cyanobacteriota bacterium]
MTRKSSRRWALPTVFQLVWHRFVRDARSLPSQAWRRWRGTLALGFGITSIIAYIVTRLGQYYVSRGLQTWDEKMLPILARETPLSFARGVTWESPGNLVGALPVVICLVLFCAWISRPLLAASFASGYILQFAFAWVGWGTWNRARPDLIAEGLAAPELHSYPSGHTIIVVTIYGLIVYLWFRASRSILERLLAVAIGIAWIGLVILARIVLGTHWPSDTIAGLAIGIPWLITLIVALNRAESAL